MNDQKTQDRLFLTSAYRAFLACSATFVLGFEYSGHYRVYQLPEDAHWLSPVVTDGSIAAYVAAASLVLLVAFLFDGEIQVVLEWVLSFLADKNGGTDVRAKRRRRLRMLVSLLIPCTLIALGRHFLTHKPLSQVIADFRDLLMGDLRSFSVLFAVAVFSGLLYSALRWLAPRIRKADHRTVYLVWSASTSLLLPTYLLFLVASLRTGQLPEGAWCGLLKDYFVLFLISAVYLSGFDRLSRSRSLSRGQWFTLLSLCAGFAGLMLYADHKFCLALEQTPQNFPLLPWQCKAMIKFIHLRNWASLVPLVSIHGVVLIGRVLKDGHPNDDKNMTLGQPNLPYSARAGRTPQG